jgi:hypothetical protein
MPYTTVSITSVEHLTAAAQLVLDIRRHTATGDVAGRASAHPQARPGSGSTESANKLVVDARLKSTDMHWAHVDPLVALRTIACADRWAEAWPRITLHHAALAGGRLASTSGIGNRACRRPTTNASAPGAAPPVGGTVPDAC